MCLTNPEERPLSNSYFIYFSPTMSFFSSLFMLLCFFLTYAHSSLTPRSSRLAFFQVLFIRPGGSARQTLSGITAEAGRYTIQFAVGRRLDLDFPLTAVAELRAKPSGVVVASLNVEASQVAAGTFEQGWLAFTLSGNESYIGDDLELSFRALGEPNTQVLFDNVRVITQFVDIEEVSTVIMTTEGVEEPEVVPQCAATCPPRYVLRHASCFGWRGGREAVDTN